MSEGRVHGRLVAPARPSDDQCTRMSRQSCHELLNRRRLAQTDRLGRVVAELSWQEVQGWNSIVDCKPLDQIEIGSGTRAGSQRLNDCCVEPLFAIRSWRLRIVEKPLMPCTAVERGAKQVGDHLEFQGRIGRRANSGKLFGYACRRRSSPGIGSFARGQQPEIVLFAEIREEADRRARFDPTIEPDAELGRRRMGAAVQQTPRFPACVDLLRNGSRLWDPSSELHLLSVHASFPEAALN
jgi:hypothetical protein